MVERFEYLSVYMNKKLNWHPYVQKIAIFPKYRNSFTGYKCSFVNNYVYLHRLGTRHIPRLHLQKLQNTNDTVLTDADYLGLQPMMSLLSWML